MENLTLVKGAIELLRGKATGTLATQSLKHPGFPFVSSAPFGLDTHGNPVFLLSSLATHTRNLKHDSKSSMLAAASDKTSDARLTLIGNLELLPESDLAFAKESYLQRHPDAQQWASFGDFAFYRLVPIDLYLVAGFGAMGWIKPEDYSANFQTFPNN